MSGVPKIPLIIYENRNKNGQNYQKKMGKMKILLATLLMLGLSACERHEDGTYFKYKCTAELNGETYIDQRRVETILSPTGQITPRICPDETDGFLYFVSYLCTEAGMTTFTYMVEIYFPAGPLDELVGREYDLGIRDSGTDIDEYPEYCKENSIPYATVTKGIMGETADKGSFQITSRDEDTVNGNFTLHFSEGTMTGRFYCTIKE